MAFTTGLTLRAFANGLRAKKFSAYEITEEYFKNIESHDKDLGAFLSLDKEGALKAAHTVDVTLAAGEELSPLAGAPLAIKDNMLIEGLPATAGSKILLHYRAAYDATVIGKLKAARAVFLGKTNLDEFAMGSSTENSGFHITRNPHDRSRVPGGSSGGSAAAVAADMALAALGSDTGGSIREPASFCGVVGLKPTYGAVSRYGLIAMASSLDQIGPLARTVEDAALVFQEIAGPDAFDATSAAITYGRDIVSPDMERVKSLVVGLPDEYFSGGLTPEVERAVQAAVSALRKAGIKMKPVKLPHTEYALSCYYIVMPAEVSSNLARFDGVRYGAAPGRKVPADLLQLYLKARGEGFGSEAKRRIMLGTFVLSSGYYDAYYAKAQKVRRLIKDDFENVFKEVDVLLGPVAPTPAFKIGEKTEDPLRMYLSDIFTIPVNLAGLPAIAIPVKNVPGLPIGFQLIGRHFREADILGLGRYYESL